MSKILKSAMKIVLPLLLAGGLLYWMYRDFEFAEVKRVFLHEMNLWWLFASLIPIALSHMLRGLRWLITLEPLGYRPRKGDSIDSIFIAYATNVVLPRVGEVSRCMVLERYDKVPFAQSLGTLVSERLVDTLMVLLITLVAVLSQWGVFFAFVSEAGANGDAAFSSVGRMAVLLLSFTAVCTVLYFVIRKMKLWTKVKSFLVRFWDGFSSLAKIRNLLLFVIETVGIWFCYFMQFYLCFFCFPFSSGLSLGAALLLFVAGSVAVVVPTPNGAGPWHFAVMSIMMLYGVAQVDAGIFALIVHTLQTLLVAVLGIYGLMMLQFKKT